MSFMYSSLVRAASAIDTSLDGFAVREYARKNRGAVVTRFVRPARYRTSGGTSGPSSGDLAPQSMDEAAQYLVMRPMAGPDSTHELVCMYLYCDDDNHP